VRLDLDMVDLSGAVDAAIEALRPTADTKGVLLSVMIDSSVPAIPADGRRLQQILWNLLHNAVKFTPRGGRVDVSVTRSNTYVGIAVRDTGQGIDADFFTIRLRSLSSGRSVDNPLHVGGLALGCRLLDTSLSSMEAISRRRAPAPIRARRFSSSFL
jgi:signal transduction histidine kinase